jgi:HD-GYP domain-containing protein (c-di-GMP phosphodiesterase class II)
MGSYILLIGEATPGDQTTCASVAGMSGLDIRYHAGKSVFTIESGEGLPGACISFLPCDRNTILSVFGDMPLGFGQEIPFFQKVDTDAAASAFPAFLSDLPIEGYFQCPLSELAVRNMVSAIRRHEQFMEQNREIIGEIMKYRRQKHQLIKIATSLSQHSDLDSLLASILLETRDIVAADAGSIYIREKEGPGGKFTNKIRFKISQNDSVDIGHKSEEFVIAIDKTTVAGYVAETGQLLNIEDIFKLGDGVPYKIARKEYERKFDYRVKSMLTVPLKNMAGEVAGVLQLMNKKSDKNARLATADDVDKTVAAFTMSDEDFILSIASQAAVSIERVQLYQEIQSIFEGYLKSSIAAIDERDRVTSGHSRRVMGYALAFADAVNRENGGPFGGERFDETRKNQFRFSALLHDIGKIGVPEALLTKETRLSKDAMAAVAMRAEYIRAQMRPAGAAGGMFSWSSEKELDEDVEFINKINGAGFLSDPDHARLSAIAKKQFADTKGQAHTFLSDQEFESLAVRKGNLTDKERDRINSHAQATRRILSRIPWTRELEGIPDIACHHHEKLDGSGYPDGLKGDRLSFESKALAVIDIYEALVAQDRPYKPKMPPEKAIEILRAEVRVNHLDAAIVEFFVANNIYKIFLDEQIPDARPA